MYDDATLYGNVAILTNFLHWLLWKLSLIEFPEHEIRLLHAE